MVDSADIHFIQHFADIYFSKFVCISVCGGYQVSHTYCQVSFFFLSNFQALKVFVIFFSGTVRPRRLKLGTHMNNGWMYRVYGNQAAAAYLSFFHFSFSPLIKH